MSLFGGTQPGGGNQGAGLFGAKPAGGGGLFGNAAPSQPAPGASQPAGGGLFSKTGGGGGLFAANGPPKIGQAPLSGAFGDGGAPAPSASNGTGLFGGNGPPGGLLDKMKASNSALPAPAAGTGLFGQGAPQQTSSQPQAASGLFGGLPKSTTLAPSSSGLFGQGAPQSTASQPQATGGLFGGPPKSTTQAPPSGVVFGSGAPQSTTTPPAASGLFGAPKSTTSAPSSSGLFGQGVPQSTSTAPAAGSGLFGSKAAPQLGLQAAAAGLQQPKETGGLFGGNKLPQSNPTSATHFVTSDQLRKEGKIPPQPSLGLFGGANPDSKPKDSASGGLLGGGAKPPSQPSLLGADAQKPKEGNAVASVFGQKPQEQINSNGVISSLKPAAPLNDIVNDLTKVAQNPNLNPAQKVAAKSDLEKYHENFQKNTLNIIGEKWHKQLDRNEAAFDNCTKELQAYELKLINQVKSIEQVQHGSKALLGQYRNNIVELTDVQTQQTSIINELMNIEAELDLILPNEEEYSNLYQSNPLDQPDVSLRKQVHENAKMIDCEVENLQIQLNTVTNELDQQTLRNKNDDLMRLQAMQVGADPEFQNSVKTTQDMEQILSTYYDTLQWIQSSAVDLQFQTQELEQKINIVKGNTKQY